MALTSGSLQVVSLEIPLFASSHSLLSHIQHPPSFNSIRVHQCSHAYHFIVSPSSNVLEPEAVRSNIMDLASETLAEDIFLSSLLDYNFDEGYYTQPTSSCKPLSPTIHCESSASSASTSSSSPPTPFTSNFLESTALSLLPHQLDCSESDLAFVDGLFSTSFTSTGKLTSRWLSFVTHLVCLKL